MIIASHLHVVQAIQERLRSIGAMIDTIARSIPKEGANATANTKLGSELSSKEADLRLLYQQADLLLRDKRNHLDDLLRYFTRVAGELDDYLLFFSSLRHLNFLSACAGLQGGLGATPRASKRLAERFSEQLADFDLHCAGVIDVLAAGNRLLQRCSPDSSTTKQLKLKLDRLKDLYDTTQSK